MTNGDEKINEKFLISETLKGNTKAFQPIVETNWNLVFSIISRRIKDRETVADLCQETFLSAYAKLNQFKTEQRLAPWLAKIAVNKALEFIRKDRNATFIDLNLELTALGNGSPDNHSNGKFLLDNCIDALSESLQILFILRHGLSFSYDDIAYVLDVPVGTVKASFFRIRNELRARIETEHDHYQLANGDSQIENA